MILTALLIAAGIIAGVGIISVFWNDIVSWLKRAINKVGEIVSGIVYGAKVFIKKISDGIKEISKHYSKQGTVWQETIVTKIISENDVPREILQHAEFQKELDITDELEQQLA